MSGGHRQIAYLGYREQTWTNRQRYSGYCDALRSRRLAIRPELVRQGLVTSALAEEATIELLGQARAPTALFTAQASITIGAVRALLSRHENHRTALVGFDDFDRGPTRAGRIGRYP
jgi:LacI family transcriptional regulator